VQTARPPPYWLVSLLVVHFLLLQPAHATIIAASMASVAGNAANAAFETAASDLQTIASNTEDAINSVLAVPGDLINDVSDSINSIATASFAPLTTAGSGIEDAVNSVLNIPNVNAETIRRSNGAFQELRRANDDKPGRERVRVKVPKKVMKETRTTRKRIKTKGRRMLSNV